MVGAVGEDVKKRLGQVGLSRGREGSRWPSALPAPGNRWSRRWSRRWKRRNVSWSRERGELVGRGSLCPGGDAPFLMSSIVFLSVELSQISEEYEIFYACTRKVIPYPHSNDFCQLCVNYGVGWEHLNRPKTKERIIS